MRPLDEIYTDETLASLYDHFNRWGPSDEFYLRLARQTGGSVLDLGCGTGMLASRIAAERRVVTGVDPAEAMLKVARARPGAEKVQWVKRDGRNLELSQRFEFIYMTGHAFQALLTDVDALAVLAAVAGHLEPGGRFAFETRNPGARAWLSWTPALSRRVADTAEHGRVEETSAAVHDVATGIVAIRHGYRFLDRGTERHGTSHLRFVDQPHLQRLIVQAGLAPVAFYGDWDKSPLRPESPEIIAVTTLA